MRLLFAADGRSPIAVNWIEYFVSAGHEVHLASSFPCEPLLPLASFRVIPVAFSGIKSGQAVTGGASRRGNKSLIWGSQTLRLRTAVRHWLGLLSIPKAAQHLTEYAGAVKPDLVHAMRIPYEGILASRAALPAPLLVSVWGNDFTLHARSNAWMGAATRRVVEAADALHADCRRDIRLALAWGFSESKPSIVLPGGGGIRTERFYPPSQPVSSPVVVNPRGFRAYVRNDTFFRAVPLVLQKVPEARFLCPAMQEEEQAHRWLEEYRIREAVELMPRLPHSRMADLFRRAQVVVSPSTHDGTPNTLLEALACGCFPVAGDLESVREWIDPGSNGLLVDPADPQALADAVVLALQDANLRARAMDLNLKMVSERAERRQVMTAALEFYKEITKSAG